MDKKTILIIDDVKFNIRAAQDVLGEDFKVIGALSAEAGFKVLSHTIPDLILLDIIMPETDGHQVLKILKSTPRFMHIPVIFLTADNNYETEVEGFNEGIVDYITKPFVADVLKKRIPVLPSDFNSLLSAFPTNTHRIVVFLNRFGATFLSECVQFVK